MIKHLPISLLLVFAPASAQVTIKPLLPQGEQMIHAGKPSNYGINVLAGSQRQISAILRGSSSMLVNWSVVNAYGGGTATLDRSTNAIPLVNVTVGSTQGNCSTGGTLGAYTVTSTVGFTVRATSVDDVTKTADYPFKVCANTTQVAIQPAYQQAYRTERVALQSYVIGNTNEAGTWSITTQPSGGDGALADTTKRDALFTASVTGRYVLTYTSAADSSKSANAAVFVGGSIPPYGLSTPNLTASVPCDLDPTLTGTVFEVGAGYAYANPAAANVSFIAAAPGSIMRIHNTDTTGTAPSTYHNYLFLDGQNKGGSAGQPKIICGVPDATGHLPVLDATNATGTHGAAGAGNGPAYGLLSIWGNQQYNGTYAAGSIGPSYMIVSGLQLKNVTEAATYTDTNGVAQNYGPFGACLNVRSGWYNVLAGNDISGCRNGIFTQSNGAFGFSLVTEFFYYRGNHFKSNSASYVAGQHHIYNSTWYPVFEGNLFEDLVPNAGGNMVKDRGQEPIYRYNAALTTNGGYVHAINGPSDSPQYFTFEAYLGAQGDTSCNTPYCSFDQTLSANQLVANQEPLFKSFIYGDIYNGRRTDIALIQFNDSEEDTGYDSYNQSEISDHLGLHYFYFNTVNNAGQAIFSMYTPGYDDDPQPFRSTLVAQNNIFYHADTGTLNLFSLVSQSSIVAQWKTNLFNKGTLDLTIPVADKQFIARAQTAVSGWISTTNRQQYDWNGTTLDSYGNPGPTISIDKHQTGIDATNFLFTASVNGKPYNSATFAPTVGSDAIGAASTITDPQMLLLPVRSQYNMETHQVEARTNLTTVGAVGSGSLPTLSSLALRADAAAFLSQKTGTCGYFGDGATSPCLPQITGNIYIPIPLALKGTYSDGLVSDVGPDATWSGPGVTFYASNEMAPNVNSAIQGYVYATYGGVSMTAPFGYNGGIPPFVQSLINSLLGGSFTLGGSGQIH